MLHRRAVLVLLLGLARTSSGAVPAGMAAITFEAPRSLAGTFPGYFSSASASPPAGKLRTFSPDDPSGCSVYSAPSGRAMTVVGFGNCSVAQKVARAQEAGMLGVMLVSDSDIVNRTLLNDDGGIVKFSIFAVGVDQEMGTDIIAWNTAHSDDSVQASVVIYKGTFPLADPTVLLLVALAVSLIVLGAWVGTADLRIGSPVAPTSEDEVLTLEWWLPFAWVASASVALVVLYFTMQWLIWIVLAVFGCGGIGTMSQLIHAGLRYHWPGSLQKPLCTLPCIGAVEIAQIIGLTVGIANSAAWFFLRKTPYAWPFQNMIGICFLCFFQRTIRLPSIKLAASLLSLMFFFDIFWVFVSPLFFSQSVMVAVAMGGGSGEVAPMLLRIPAWGHPLEGDRMLGYGDIAIPGLLISFLRRHDLLSYREWRAGYFVPAVVGYGLGMCCALTALYLMQMGQPALLYLVPGTLGTTMVLACKRGEVKALWEGNPCANPNIVRTLPVCKFCPGGHLLRAGAAPQGTCDGCKQKVGEGQVVMDCRVCNWYLCEACRPRSTEEVAEDAEASLS